MNDQHRQWLKQAEAESIAKQEQFMNGIAQKLRRPRVTEKPVHPFRGAPEFWREFELTQEERIAAFSNNWKMTGGHVVRLPDMEAAKRFIVDNATELSAKYIVRQDQPELEALDFEGALPDTRITVWNRDKSDYMRARAAESDIGIVMADYAVAYTGSLTVLSAANKGRSVSLLPTSLMAIVPVERLHTRLGQVLGKFDEIGRENMPAGIHFISGPSRSADIENDLTIGVHGPGVVYALLIG